MSLWVCETEVWKLVVVNYIDALEMLEKLALDRKLHHGRCDTLLSLQQPPTYTVDKRQTVPNLLITQSELEKIESTMIEPAAAYGVKACPGQSGETGVWVGERKIGAIGFQILTRITSHGMAFNIDPDLSHSSHILFCRIAGKEVTSLIRDTDIVPSQRRNTTRNVDFMFCKNLLL